MATLQTAAESPEEGGREGGGGEGERGCAHIWKGEQIRREGEGRKEGGGAIVKGHDGRRDMETPDEGTREMQEENGLQADTVSPTDASYGR